MICSKCRTSMIPSIEYDLNRSWTPLWKCTASGCANHEFASFQDVNLWNLWKARWKDSGVNRLTVNTAGLNESRTLIFEDVSQADEG